ncbi:MAG: amino acid ABC transporter substrate-binding protein [Solirubrobacteraceae bacterium]|nr:amino acid ABC transporter substrate-binding protein [Solirubrobacteraceae bacterium]
MIRSSAAALAAIACALGFSACGDDDDGGGNESAATPTTAMQTTAAAECRTDQLKTLEDGVLTIGTDKPAYPPYFEDDDPTNGRGFESEVAYAVAEELGFPKQKVEWTTVPFNSSYAPGEKKFDFDINQISITPARQKRVDFSTPYFTAPQAVVALEGTSAAKAQDLSGLKDAKLGVQVGTTSLDAVNDVIKPSTQPKVFNDSNDTVAALKNKSVDAIVVDLPTALYINAAEIDDSTVVGQFAAPGGDEWGLLLEKESPLTPCVDAALERLRSDGELDRIRDAWLGEDAAPQLD